jgi:Flp pilus assembly protein TadG
MFFTDHQSQDSLRATAQGRRAQGDRGAVAAEFALILPILLVLIFGMVQLGLTYQRQEAVHAAAREGARVASLPTTTTAQACARSTAALVGTGFDATPTCGASSNCSTSTGDVIVTITVSNTIDIPFFGTQTFDLTGTGDFRCE